MKSYSPNGTPEFADSIQICETTDKGHADNINVAPMQLLENDLALKNELICNMLYIADFTTVGSYGGAGCVNGHYTCSVPDENVVVWSGEISLPKGGCAYPAASDSADVIVVYTLDGAENRVEISSGAVLPEGAVVTEYRLERKDGESRIVADIWPMISPGKRPISEYVPYTGDERKINRCVAFVIKSLEKLHKFCVEKFLAEDCVANNLGTTNEGWVLDARQGNVLDSKINKIDAGLSQMSNCDLLASTSSTDGAFVALATARKYRYLYFGCYGYDNLYAEKFIPTHVIFSGYFHRVFDRNTETNVQFSIAEANGAGITIYPTLLNSGTYAETQLWGVSKI